jgi:hypothetical protein
VSAIDLRDWLDELEDDDVDLLAMRFAGCTLEDIGDEAGTSVSGAFSRCRKLGHQLRERIADGGDARTSGR